MQYQRDDRMIAVWIGRSQYERDNDNAVRLHQCTQRSGDRYRNRLSDREIAMLPSFSDRWIAVNIYAMQKHVCTSLASLITDPRPKVDHLVALAKTRHSEADGPLTRALPEHRRTHPKCSLLMSQASCQPMERQPWHMRHLQST